MTSRRSSAALSFAIRSRSAAGLSSLPSLKSLSAALRAGEKGGRAETVIFVTHLRYPDGEAPFIALMLLNFCLLSREEPIALAKSSRPASVVQRAARAVLQLAGSRASCSCVGSDRGSSLAAGSTTRAARAWLQGRTAAGEQCHAERGRGSS